MMAGRAAVIVEVDPLLDRRGDEAEHLIAMVLHGVAIIPRRFIEAEIDSETGAEAAHPRLNAPALEDRLEAAIEPPRPDREYVSRNWVPGRH